MLNTLNVNLNTDLKVTRAPDLGIEIKSQDINNNLFILRFTDKGKAIELDETYTVEILTKFEKSKSHRLTSATVYRDYARWEFDTSFITMDEKVTNYVYVRKSGNLVVSADANAFTFAVGLSEIDKDAGRVAETYDENYEKVLLDYSGALDDRTTERLDEAVDDFNQRGDAEIADWRVDADVELEDYLADRVVLKNLTPAGSPVYHNGVSSNVLNADTDETEVTITSLGADRGIRHNIDNNINDIVYVYAEYLTKGWGVLRLGVSGNRNRIAIKGVGEYYKYSSVGRFISRNITFYHDTLEGNSYEVGDSFKINKKMVINLTQTFGAGNEPSKEIMDRLIEQTGYFDEHILDENWQVGEILRLNDTKSDKIGINNLITNGDFSDGGQGWGTGSNIPSVTFGDNYIEFEGGGPANGSTSNWISHSPSVMPDAGDILYTCSLATRISGEGNIYIGSGYSIAIGNIPLNEKTFVSHHGVPNQPPMGNNRNVVLTADAGVTVRFEPVVYLNLTKTFGAGNEPTKEWMDRLIEKTGYFDEHILDENWQVREMLRLDNTKANKVQEAWITPTLLNGATGDIQFRKNQFGRVEFKGTVTGTNGVAVFGLPIGYHPNNTFRTIVKTNDSSTQVRAIIFNNGGTAYFDQPSGTFEVYFDNVSFSTN